MNFADIRTPLIFTKLRWVQTWKYQRLMFLHKNQ